MVLNSYICKLNKFGHCKFGEYGHFKHVNQKRSSQECDAKNCDLRHPRKCIKVLQGQPCKFGNSFSFEHGIVERTVSSDIEQKLRDLITNLQNAIAS